MLPFSHLLISTSGIKLFLVLIRRFAANTLSKESQPNPILTRSCSLALIGDQKQYMLQRTRFILNRFFAGMMMGTVVKRFLSRDLIIIYVYVPFI